MLNKTGYREIQINLLVESPHNPRRRFNEKSLAELAASIKEHGILTPLLVRPDDGAFEIAAGHRRFRAAKLAGFVTVPAIVRDMTDQQFMEVLTVENLQREDVHAYEEAQGYRELLRIPGYDLTAVAAKIGRSESYVRSRLKLLDLVDEVAQAFLEDRITFAHARLIAPLPAEKQAEALENCFAKFGRNLEKRELLPVSELREWIRDSEGEDLSDAPFSLDDPDLNPAAGPCLLCPKSTCGDGRLFADEQGGETCYDKKCFEGKVEAHVRTQARNGLVAISTSYHKSEQPAGALVPQEFTEIREPYKPENGEQEFEPEPDEQKCSFMEQAVVVSGHNKGDVKTICRNPKCPVHGKQEAPASKGSQPTGRQIDYEQKARDEARKAEWAKRRDLYDRICSTWAPIVDREMAFLLIVDAIGTVYSVADLQQLAEEFGIAKQNDPTAQRAAIYTWAEKASAVYLRGMLMRILLRPHIERWPHASGYDLLEIAKEQLVDQIEPKPAPKAAAKKAAKKR
ncbi:MAG: ParB/RepB/Spo0J family partition protein [Patescibacteria group bacterium]|nr:ParB/RepB/Spo0J family partition protein [Patescibacteria group bacterium]